MIQKDFIKNICEIFDPFFTHWGFISLSVLEYRKKINNIEHRIIYAPQVDKNSGSISLTSGGVGIRIPQIEELIHPNDNFSTVGMPLHLLKPEKEYREWIFNGVQDIGKNAPQILRDVEIYGLPFLNKFVDADSVYISLKSERTEDWFMCTEVDRDALIVAFVFVDKGKEAAMQMAELLLSKYENRPLKYSKSLRNVISKLKEVIK